MKSPRNKTINISAEEGREYLERCISVSKPAILSDITDKTIIGDTFREELCRPCNSRSAV